MQQSNIFVFYVGLIQTQLYHIQAAFVLALPKFGAVQPLLQRRQILTVGCVCAAIVSATTSIACLNEV